MQVGATRVLFWACVLAAGPLAGCQSFRSSKELDSGAFAENTVSLAGEIQRYNRPPVWVYLNAHEDRPSIGAVRTTAREVRRLLQSITLYSMQVVALHEARLKEGQRVAEFARFIDEVSRPGLLAGKTADIGLSVAEFESTLARIRSRDTLREALAAAQPLVAAVMAYGQALFDQADQGVAAAAEDLEQQIEFEFQPLLENSRKLGALHMRIVASFELLYRIRLGESALRSELLAADPELAPFFPAGEVPTLEVLDAAEQRLTSQLEHIGTVRAQLEPQFLVYREHLRELESMRTQTEEMLRLGRLTLSIWSRSHRNLAAGIPVPPEIDLGKLLERAAKVGNEVF